MKRIAIFASGEGTNAENIIRYFHEKKTAEVVIVMSDRKNAPALQRAAGLKVMTKYIQKEFFENGYYIAELLVHFKIDLVVLAGFLKLIPVPVIKKYENRMVNIHPALLPQYGGKGMYGMKVHQAVVKNKEKETGITIHYVNEKYDEGKIIFQKKIEVSETDTPEDVSKKVSALEMEYFPKVIEGPISLKF